jgi:hypothetical protein
LTPIVFSFPMPITTRLLLDEGGIVETAGAEGTVFLGRSRMDEYSIMLLSQVIAESCVNLLHRVPSASISADQALEAAVGSREREPSRYFVCFSSPDSLRELI